MAIFSYILLDLLPPTGWTFYLAVSDEVSGERGQQIRVKQLGPDLWAARYESSLIPTDIVRRAKSHIMGLMSDRGTFYGWDPHGQFPKSDPKGQGLYPGGVPAAVKINSLNADYQRMSLKGLPPYYVLSAGDYLSFDYNSQRALHQLWNNETVTANVFGTTSEFYVSPRIRPGASIDAGIVLIRPFAQMMIVPGSFVATEGPRFGSLSFDALQVLP